ncbi:membrane protein [Ureibacillus massiliensis 4400831 = CIP 108448 = CCUG 49529]|uniref:Membrane protein n=1 Tax=Ureibacillus massiliensis 4400831 = CIP 108448 = CCUG 49529 TaxID=1211035 RepID=A0A0A3J1S6_9BACL|nr:YhgE/Pip domain-containing protein [Ureibacillus massiliensis]KGR90866.1 membrane protein [Ureibacillus massiliensis 4400831 = CIP 108448 = CCUG 49529]
MKRSAFLAELKSILLNRKILIPILAVAFVPVLYAGMFLWAFWDPYAHMEDLPVAIVNEDTGADFEGEALHLGNELANKLENSEQFNFQIVSKEEGYEGLENREYYLLIEIPKDFSANATTILDNDPKKLEITYVPNESTNFLSSQIGETAIKEIKAEISKNITSTYAETMFSKVTDLASGLDQASEGSSKLADGVIELSDGSKTLHENLELLASKSIEFTNGINSATSGASQIAVGTDQLSAGLKEVNANLPALIDGTNTVQNGLELMKEQLPSQVANGISEQLAGSVDNINAGIDQMDTQLSANLSSQLTEGIVNGLSNELAEQMVTTQSTQMEQIKAALVANQVMSEEQANSFITQLVSNSPTKEQIQQQYETQLTNQLQPQITAGIENGLDQGFTQLKTSLSDQLLSSTANLDEQLAEQVAPSFDQMLAGLGKINEGQLSLQQGVNELYKGSVDLNTGAGNLNKGLKQLSSGADQLHDGAGQLAEGSKELETGTDKLLDGSNELATKLADGAEQANSVHADEDTYDMMGEPVLVNKQEINAVPNYGTGFAPYFISLGLFVGALLISIVFPLKEPVVKPKNALQWFISKFGVLAIIGIIQALLVDLILLVGLKMEITNLPLFIITSIITSFVFLTLVQMLVTMMGDPGRFIAIIVLILQLTTSAGTFPLELIPNALQPFSALLPMTYSVHSFKAVISSGDISYMWHNNAILLCYMAAFILMTIGYFKVSMKRYSRVATETK